MQVADAYLKSFSPERHNAESKGRVVPIVTTVAIHALILFGIAVSTGMVPTVVPYKPFEWVPVPEKEKPVDPIEQLSPVAPTSVYVPPQPNKPIILEGEGDPPVRVTTEIIKPIVGPSVEAVPTKVASARLLRSTEPLYPGVSRIKEEEGVVVVRLTITARGTVSDAQLEKSSGYTRLDEAALASVRSWRFVPAKRGNEAVESSVLVPVRFELRRQ